MEIFIVCRRGMIHLPFYQDSIRCPRKPKSNLPFKSHYNIRTLTFFLLPLQLYVAVKIKRIIKTISHQEYRVRPVSLQYKNVNIFFASTSIIRSSKNITNH